MPVCEKTGTNVINSTGSWRRSIVSVRDEPLVPVHATNGTKEDVAACSQAMAPPSPFSAGSYHEPVLMRLWQAVFSPTSPRERQYERFISRECTDNDEELQCSPAC